MLCSGSLNASMFPKLFEAWKLADICPVAAVTVFIIPDLMQLRDKTKPNLRKKKTDKYFMFKDTFSVNNPLMLNRWCFD